MDRVIVPINIHDTHWCCGIIEVPERTVRILDSMTPYEGYGKQLGEALAQYMCDEHAHRKVCLYVCLYVCVYMCVYIIILL